jgi:hypothetical protein
VTDEFVESVNKKPPESLIYPGIYYISAISNEGIFWAYHDLYSSDRDGGIVTLARGQARSDTRAR